MKKFLNSSIKCFLVFVSILISGFMFSACTININAENLVPELFVNTDADLEYIYNDDVYRVIRLPGETYEISADLGDYDESEYYIEISLESEESILTLDENKITVSESAEVGVVENVFVKLKKVGEEKTYQTEIIEVVIVLEKS